MAELSRSRFFGWTRDFTMVPHKHHTFSHAMNWCRSSCMNSNIYITHTSLTSPKNIRTRRRCRLFLFATVLNTFGVVDGGWVADGALVDTFDIGWLWLAGLCPEGDQVMATEKMKFEVFRFVIGTFGYLWILYWCFYMFLLITFNLFGTFGVSKAKKIRSRRMF